jgi:SecD/SecF fusion protein
MEKNAGLKFTFIGILVALWLLFFALSGINLGLDLKGGFELLYRLDVPPDVPPGSNLTNETIEVIQKRIDSVGLKEIKVQSSGGSHIIVSLPGGSEAEKEDIKGIVERMGVLWFALVAPNKGGDPYLFPKEEIEKVRKEEKRIAKLNEKRLQEGKPALVPEKMVVPYIRQMEGGETEAGEPVDSWKALFDIVAGTGIREKRIDVIIETVDRVSGGLLTRTYPTQDDWNRPAVGFSFGSEGANLFRKLTREENRGRFLAIILDGTMQSAPRIEETIGGSGIIKGQFTPDEVRQQVIILKSGSLPTKPVLDREFSVGPMLGEIAIQRGIVAIIAALCIVLVIMGIYYLAAGMLANLALVINIILILGSLAASEATFTLPGLAGLVLTVGMAVDANILIFERIREEKAKGKSLRQATETGFARAFWTIFDANVTTLLTALILLWAGTGPIQGFAVTLSIGILCSMFAALFVTRAFLGFLIGKRVLTELKMLQLLRKPSVGFVKARHIAFAISMIAIVAGVFLFFSRGDEKYGIDFTGGSLFQIDLRKPEPIRAVKETVRSIEGLENAEVVATYMDYASEKPQQGIAISFTIRTRTVEAPEKTAEGERKRGFQEVLHERIEEAFKGRLAPTGIDSSKEVREEQEEFERNNKAVIYAFARKTDEPEKLAQVAEKTLGEGSYPGASVKVAEIKEEGLDDFVRLRIETGELDLVDTPLEKVITNVKNQLLNTKSIKLSESFPRVDAIGASVAYNLKSKAVVALTLAMIGIILYIAVRFELKYGFAAVFALGHDVAIALGVISLVDMFGLVEIKIDLPVIAAFLTIVGYSLNDTIVVFDRIRENLRRKQYDARKGKEGYAEVINDSINETLSRTLLTSFTTFIVVLVLFLSGVEAITGFTFAMLVGVVVGTYSSIFIASPILIFMRPAAGRQQQKK